MLAHSSRALALSHSGLTKEGKGDAAAETVLREAAEAMVLAGAGAKSCRLVTRRNRIVREIRNVLIATHSCNNAFRGAAILNKNS